MRKNFTRTLLLPVLILMSLCSAGPVFGQVPGNALAFDGGTDYITVPANAAFSFGTGDFTVEAWVRTTSVGLIIGRSNVADVSGYSFGFSGNGQFEFEIGGTAGSFSFSKYPFGHPSIRDGRWHHVVGVRKAGQARLYIDGEASSPVSAGGSANPTGNLIIGTELYVVSPTSAVSFSPFAGSIDQLRIYNTALTDAEVESNRLSVSSVLPQNLVLYYNFNQGSAGGSNPGVTTVTDQSGNNRHGTLNTFALSGTSSNWVASYAMSVPVATAATDISAIQGSIGFTINWTAPVHGGTVDGYLIDVTERRQLSPNSYSQRFFTGIPVSGTTLSRTFTGTTGPLFASTSTSLPTTYFYRIRANKLSVNGQGGYSNEFALIMPVLLIPSINAGTATGTIASCAGIASVSPNISQFTVSGNNLSGNISATAPAGFEISTLSASGYGTTLTLSPTANTVPVTTIFVRSAASAPSGAISGNVVLTSPSATTRNIAVAGTVNTPVATITAGGPTVLCVGGSVVLTASAGNTYLWSNNETTQSITVNTTGNYNVTVTDAYNCSATSAVTGVTVNPYPVVSSISTGVAAVDYLVVAGGGGGASGGGGGGGVLTGTNFSILPGQSIPVMVGAGGTPGVGGAISGIRSTSGGNSVFAGFTSIGGGGGGGGGVNTQPSLPGGSGGGGGYDLLNITRAPGTPGQGFNGGRTNFASYGAGAGGGGAGAPGSDAPVLHIGGNGGDGILSNISGTAAYYGGGGGGGINQNNNATTPNGGGVGGLGGGGTGSSMGYTCCAFFNGTAGTPGTGGGGGGTDPESSVAGAGGSGIVIIRYAGVPSATGGTITQSGGYTIHTFSGVGSHAFNNGGGSSICVGGTTVYTNATPGGVWSSSNTGIATVDNTGTITGVAAGTAVISYTVSGGGDCNTTVTAEVTVNPLPDAVISGTATVCRNAAAPVISFTGSNGTAPYTFTYTINGGAPQTLVSTGDVAVVNVPTNIPGSFTYALVAVKGSGASACTNSVSGTATVTVAPLPTATLSGPTAVCHNGNPPPITFTGNNGTAPYTFTYTINNGAPQTVTSVGNQVTIPIATGVVGSFTYSLISVTESGSGCTGSVTGFIPVVVRPIPVINSITGNTTICSGTQAVLNATAANAVNPTFIWYDAPGAGNILFISTGGADFITPVLTASTVYYVAVLDIGNNCSSPVRTAVPVTVNTISATATETDVSCPGGTDGSITVTAAGNDAPYQYSNDGGLNYQASNVFSGLPAGNYTIVARSAGNCLSAPQQVTIGTVPDITKPVPDMASLPVLTGECSVAVNNPPTATDNCAGTVTGTTTNPLLYHSQGTYTITWSYDDGNGNIHTQTQTVIVKDVTAPVLSGTPAPNLTASCDNIPYAATVSATDNCTPSPAVSYFQVPNVSVNTLHHWPADNHLNDIAGTAHGTAVGTVNFAPGLFGSHAFSFTGNSYINAGTAGSVSGTGDFAVTAWIKTTSSAGMTVVQQRDADISGQYSLKIATNHNGGASNPGKVYFIVAGAEGLGEVFSSLSVNDGKWHHIVGERSGNTIRIYIDGVLNATASTGGIVNMNAVGAIRTTIGADIRNMIFSAPPNYFNGLIDMVKVYSASACPSAFERDRYWITSDAVGNYTAFNQNLHIVDVTGPVITCPSDITVNAAPGLCAAAVSFTATATDNCGTATLSYSIAPGSSFNVGTTPVTVTATDQCGNTSVCSFMVTVVDNQPPSIVCPVNINITATSAAGAVVSYTAPVGTDNCPGAITVRTGGLASGSTFPIGVTTVTHTVTDGAGLTAACSFDVTVTGLAPVINCSSDISVAATAGLCGANVYYAATETTGIPASVITYSIAPGSFFAVGTTAVTATATNAVGTTSCTFMVTVTDTEKPVPVLASLPTITGECSAAVTAPLATDNCAGPIVGTTTDPTSYTVQGTYTITWTYDDGSGNTFTQTQTVIVDDITAPVANTPVLPTITGECAAGVTAPTAMDNCAGIVTATTSDPTSYTQQGTYMITWTYDDGNGNTSMQTQTVIVDDITAPVANTPVLPTITGECSASVTAPTATDNCSGIVIATTSDPTSYTQQGTYSITWTYDDGNGNTSTQTQTVIVDDITAPVANTPVLPTITGECAASVTAPTATDNCSGIVTATTSDPTSYTQQGTYIITWTYDDGNGNTSTQTQTVIVDDITAPVANTAVLPTITGECGASVTAPTATDNCGGTIVGTTTDPISYTAQGTYTITWTYDDGNGNSTTQTQTVIVQDITAPVPSVNTLPTVTGQCAATVTVVPTANDACTGPVTATTSDPLTYTVQGTYTVTWTYTDAYGNSSTQTQTVIVKDNIAPVPTVATLPTISGSCSAGITLTAVANACEDDCRCCRNGCHCRPGSCQCRDYDYRFRGIARMLYYWFNEYFGDDDDDHGCDNNNTGNGNIQYMAAPTATDNCKGTIVGTTTDPLTYSTPGTHIIHWTFDDGHGNITVQEQQIIVTDNIAPVPTVSNLPTIVGQCSVTIGGNGTDDDDNDDHNWGPCRAFPSIPTAKDNCVGLVYATTTDPLSYNSAGTYTIHWTYNDGHGNITTQTQTVIVKDQSAPKPVVKHLATISGNCSVTVTTIPTAKDNCTGIITATTTDPLTYTVAGTYTIRWKYNDGNGNTTTQTQTIVVVDNTRPVLNEPADITISCSASTLPATTGMATATDNCGTPVISYTDQRSGNVITRTWKATDASGNHTTDIQKITIGSSFNPVVTSVPTNNTYTGGNANNLYIGYGAQSTSLQVCTLPSSGAPYTYAWSGSATGRLNSTSSSAPVFTPNTYGTFTFVVTVTNRYGCAYTDNITICVTDIRVPGTNGAKVYVCHKTSSGKKATYQTLQVSVNAVPGHLNHGCGNNDGDDRLGSCDQAPCNSSTVVASAKTNTQTTTAEAGSIQPTTTEEELKVTVMPNPSTSFFTLKLESRNETPVNLRVMDGSGRVVDARTKLGANSSFQIGHTYSSGTYYAELMQGGKRKIVQLIKARG